MLEEFPNAIVLEDRAYWLYYEDEIVPIPFASINPDNFEKSIAFYSCGKMFNTTGLRIGVGIGPKKLLD
jgi:aspartate/methionine/tyrosine aminotransferase